MHFLTRQHADHLFVCPAHTTGAKNAVVHTARLPGSLQRRVLFNLTGKAGRATKCQPGIQWHPPGSGPFRRSRALDAVIARVFVHLTALMPGAVLLAPAAATPPRLT